MLRKKFREHLSVRIFLLTFLILLCAGAITFGLIAWATPRTYTAVVNDDLQHQVDSLTARLQTTDFEDCGPVLDEFIRASRSDVMLLTASGTLAATGSKLSSQGLREDDAVTVTSYDSGSSGTLSSSWGVRVAQEHPNATTIAAVQQYTILADVSFADRAEHYKLYVTPQPETENLAVRALIQTAPWLLLALLTFSLLCALIYSRYITRPIIRISAIAEKMAELDFDWKCGEKRHDEIGTLGRSLDRMAQRLSAALSELEAANLALQKKVAREEELARQKMAFFSAASHELKTPLTILKGQLAGMLEGIGIYQDRDKYLFRSLQTADRMEHLIQEMLAISRMETGAAAMKQDPVDLCSLIQSQIELYRDLSQHRRQDLTVRLEPGITVTGDASLLAKAIGNLLSNAILYSPDGAEIRAECGMDGGMPSIVIENSGIHIREGALCHLFEPFYREENSRSRSTGGSGLGLYLTKIILERHNALCTIENSGSGVRASVLFPLVSIQNT